MNQFWREINLHDLLLIGKTPLWFVLARHFCRFTFQLHFTVLCFPFYAAAFAGGVPIDAILLVLVLSLFLHPEVRIAIALMGWLFWFLFSFAIHQQMGLPLSISPFLEKCSLSFTATHRHRRFKDAKRLRRMASSHRRVGSQAEQDRMKVQSTVR
ncbi:MAG: hypothetical protein NZ805_13440 [Armatimonadetes bacterium]|nr:hypothetical protein [Armatimonadota bacterium]MDW8027083.1 hypothetical protein [Armatimonadota bacterium]